MTAKSLKKWGDRGDLNPRPLVPQTTSPHQATRVSGCFARPAFTAESESFPLCPVHLFNVNRGALVLGKSA